MGALGWTFEIEYVDGTTETLERSDSRIHDGVLTITPIHGYRPPATHIPLVQIKRWTSKEP
jgi:hypothetical protein